MNTFNLHLILFILFFGHALYGQGFPKNSPVPNEKTITLDENGNEIKNKELLNY